MPRGNFLQVRVTSTRRQTPFMVFIAAFTVLEGILAVLTGLFSAQLEALQQQHSWSITTVLVWAVIVAATFPAALAKCVQHFVINAWRAENSGWWAYGLTLDTSSSSHTDTSIAPANHSQSHARAYIAGLCYLDYDPATNFYFIAKGRCWDCTKDWKDGKGHSSDFYHILNNDVRDFRGEWHSIPFHFVQEELAQLTPTPTILVYHFTPNRTASSTSYERPGPYYGVMRLEPVLGEGRDVYAGRTWKVSGDRDGELERVARHDPEPIHEGFVRFERTRYKSDEEYEQAERTVTDQRFVNKILSGIDKVRLSYGQH